MSPGHRMHSFPKQETTNKQHIIIIISNEKIIAAFSPKKLQGHVTHKKDDMFGRQRKKQEGQQRHQYEVANKYVFKCRLKVDSDDDDVTIDSKLLSVCFLPIVLHSAHNITDYCRVLTQT